MQDSNSLHQRVRWVTQWLVISLAGNVALAIALVWSAWQSRPETLSLELRPGRHADHSPSLADHLHEMSKLSWEGLCSALHDDTPVEFGFCVRDLALARLVHDDGLDLQRALGRFPHQRRLCKLGQDEITLFAGLQSSDFERLQALIAREKFPLTPSGCVRRLQRDDALEPQTRSELKATLFASAPWTALEDLFRQGPPRSREQLFQLVIEVGWGPIETFWQEQRVSRDISAERRRQLLVRLFDQPSRLAGRWLLEEDPSWVQKRLSDSQVLRLIAMVLPSTQESKAFLQGILISPRSDAVRRCAGEKLFALAGEPVPEQMSILSALQRFCPEVACAMRPQLATGPVSSDSRSRAPLKAGLESTRVEPPRSPATGVASKLPAQTGSVKSTASRLASHVRSCAHEVIQVQHGDSLWKLAKRHGVSVQQIREINALQDDRLALGQTLLIPKGK